MLTKTLKTLLYVDDDENLRSLVKISLNVIGNYHLELCSSGTQALKKLQTFSPDMILLDVIMPEMSGTETLRRIKMQAEFKETPVILMTGKSDTESLALFKQSLAIGVICKPFDPLQLAEQVQYLWDQHEK